MQSFKDSQSREWKIVANVATQRAVSKATEGKVNIFEPFDGGLAKQLADPDTFCTVLWALCQGQAAETGITEDQFFAAMTGQSLVDAADALMEAIAYFYSGAKRAVLLKTIEARKAFERQLLAETEAMDVDKIVADAIAGAKAKAV